MAWVTLVLIIGLGIFGFVFAVNSCVHSFLILAYTDSDKVALSFYYMANAGGRLLGTITSGLLYQWAGLPATLWGSVIFLVLAWAISFKLPRGAAPPVSSLSQTPNTPLS